MDSHLDKRFLTFPSLPLQSTSKLRPASESTNGGVSFVTSYDYCVKQNFIYSVRPIDMDFDEKMGTLNLLACGE